MLRHLWKKVCAITVFACFVFGAFAFAPVNTSIPLVGIDVIQTAEASSKTIHRSKKNIKNRTKNKIKRNAERTINREIDRIVNLIDPNSRESREFRAKQLLRSLPYGETIVLATGQEANAIKRAIKEEALFDYLGRAKSQGGKTVGLIIYKYRNVDEMLGYDE